MFALAAYTTLTWLFRGVANHYVLTCSIVLGLVVGYDPSIGDFLYLSRIIVFFPFFWLGYCLTPAKTVSLLSHTWVKPVAIVAVIAFAALCILRIDDYYWLRYLFTGRNPFEAIGENI